MIKYTEPNVAKVGTMFKT